MSKTPTPEELQPGREDVEVLSHETLFQRYCRLDLYVLKHRLFAGGQSAPVYREVLERGHAVAVLPYDPVTDSVVLIEQFRPGAYAAGLNPWLVEVVAGIVEDGETPEAVARRELLEEAGVTAQELHPIHDYLSTPGLCSETVTLYWARVDASGAGGIHGLPEEGEDIRVLVVPFEELKELLAQGRINNATALIAVQWLLLHRDSLR